MLLGFRCLLTRCFAALILGSSAAGAASSEQVTASATPTLSPTDEAVLFRLGKVWGYLKYHHPVVRRGCLDWDSELLDILPAYVGLSNAEAGINRLESWVDALDTRECSRHDDDFLEVQFAIDREWLSDGNLLGDRLEDTLSSLKPISGHEGLQFYVVLQPGVGNPQFPEDRPYQDLEDVHWRYRLLALFRYWNIIEYWFPYRDQISSDWDDVLKEFIPRFVSAPSDDNYELELMALVAKVEDGHANVWSLLPKRPPAGELNVPAHIRWVEDQPVVWRVIDLDPEDETKQGEFDRLQYGDVILTIDGTQVDDLIEKWKPYYGGSNEPSIMREICRSMLRGDETAVHVTVDRDGTEIGLVVRRDKPPFDLRAAHDRDGDVFQSLSEDVAYLKLSAVDGSAVERYIESAMGHRGFVIDIRNYPSAFMVFALGRHLVSEATPFARFTNVDLENPGTFVWRGDPLELEPVEPRYQGKIVILVDEYSMSQSEYTAMAFRAAPGAIVVGGQTAGADGNVSGIVLPGGHRTSISGIGVFYPDKSRTQKVGIVPDIELLPTIAGIRAGRDEVLEAALTAILGNEATSEEIREMARIPHAPH